MSIGVVIIEENDLERARIVAQVVHDPMFSVVGRFATYDAAACELERISPEVIVLDVNLRSLGQIEKYWPRTKVLILSSACEQNSILSVLAAGAHGYLLKSESAARLAHAIWRVHSGNSILSSEVLDLVVRSFRGRLPLVLPLSPLQMKVLACRERGEPYKMIETDLGLSRSALKRCVREILQKTFADSTAQAVFHRSRLV